MNFEVLAAQQSKYLVNALTGEVNSGQDHLSGKACGFLRSFTQRPAPLPLVLLAEALTRRLRSQ
jgi:hypothetical protein